jgi:hypothetical protein
VVVAGYDSAELCPAEIADLREQPCIAAGEFRAIAGAGPRQRHRHSARDQGQAVPAVLYDKADRRGHRLGLSNCYDIVTQQHGGTIAVDSQVGEFTEFTIRLPRDRQAATSAGAAA